MSVIESQKHEKNSHGSVMMPSNAKAAGGTYPHSDPNGGAGDPTDGRQSYEWPTHYPRTAWVQITWEAVYLIVIFLISFFIIFATWKGWVCSFFSASPGEALTLKKYAYYVASGMLGGVAFGIKYFYRVVARGYWHQDRIIWRLKSPLLAMALAFVVGALIDASLIPTRGPSSGAAFVSIGFLVGYFADKAIAKMYEISDVIFGASGAKKTRNGK